MSTSNRAAHACVPRMLAPRGGPVELRPSMTQSGWTVPTSPDERCSFATLDRMVAVAGNAQAAMPSDSFDGCSRPIDGTAITFDFEDAARRISPSNARHVAWLERRIAVVLDIFERVDESVIRVPDADRFDMPSLRILEAAWLRRRSSPGARMILQISSDPGAACSQGLTDLAKTQAWRGVVEALCPARPEPIESANRVTPANPSSTASMCFVAEEISGEFLLRNLRIGHASGPPARRQRLSRALVDPL